MSNRRLLEILHTHKIHNVVLPSLNIWCSYVIMLIIVYATIGLAVATMAGVFFLIFGHCIPPRAKEDLRAWWNDLPQYKFHGILALVQIAAIILFAKLMFPANPIKKTAK